MRGPPPERPGSAKRLTPLNLDQLSRGARPGTPLTMESPVHAQHLPHREAVERSHACATLRPHLGQSARSSDAPPATCHVQDPLSGAATKLASVNASRPMTAGEMSASHSLPMLPGGGVKPTGSPYMEEFKLQREVKSLRQRNKELEIEVRPPSSPPAGGGRAARAARIAWLSPLPPSTPRSKQPKRRSQPSPFCRAPACLTPLPSRPQSLCSCDAPRAHCRRRASCRLCRAPMASR